MSKLHQIGEKAREAAAVLAQAPTETKRGALRAMARAVREQSEAILDDNSKEVEAARASGEVLEAMIDRLTLNEKRVAAMAAGLEAIAQQPDPVGEVVEEWTRPNGLRIQKVRVPLGVIAVIYEARPNVTADVAGLCVGAGNAAVLRGSSHALETNRAIAAVLRAALEASGLPADCVQLVEDTSREAAVELMRMKDWIDLLIPRGGPALIRSIEENATVPVIIDGDGNCHVYVDRSADLNKAHAIVINAKTQRPSVCNAAETLLVHKDIAEGWLPGMLDDLAAAGVEVRGDEEVTRLWPKATPATDEDWGREYLDLILAVRVVPSLGEAIAHVNKWGTSNAEAIVAEDDEAAKRFTREVDSGTVFVNASTRFSDGGEFGFGGEIGISTQKLHARGPMGLVELTTAKYVVWGEGQVRT